MPSPRTITSTCDRVEETMLEDHEDNPRWVMYSDAFRGPHAIKGQATKAKMMARIAHDDIFREVTLSVRMRGDTPRVFADLAAVAWHLNHVKCDQECYTWPGIDKG